MLIVERREPNFMPAGANPFHYDAWRMGSYHSGKTGTNIAFEITPDAVTVKNLETDETFTHNTTCGMVMFVNHSNSGMATHINVIDGNTGERIHLRVRMPESAEYFARDVFGGKS